MFFARSLNRSLNNCNYKNQNKEVITKFLFKFKFSVPTYKVSWAVTFSLSN